MTAKEAGIIRRTLIFFDRRNSAGDQCSLQDLSSNITSLSGCPVARIELPRHTSVQRFLRAYLGYAESMKCCSVLSQAVKKDQQAKNVSETTVFRCGLHDAVELVGR